MAEAEKHAGGGHGRGHAHAGGGHGGGHEEHEGAPEWLISFADNVMLQMGFFVILLALNLKPVLSGTGPEKGEGPAAGPTPEMLDWVIAVREAFNNPVQLDSTDPKDAALVARLVERQNQGRAREPGPEGRHDAVETIRQTEYFGMGGVVPFEHNSAVLSETGRRRVAEIAGHVRGLRTILDVRGHCAAAEAFDKPDHGMQLSWERAQVVARALVEQGIGWERLRLVACGDNDRVKPQEYDKFAVEANRRVEVVATSDTVRE